MKLLIFGATGLVGSSLLTSLKDDHEVTVAVRDLLKIDAVGIKVRKINFDDFNSFDPMEYDGIYCCLGTTIKKAGSKEAFRKVDLDYVIMCHEYAQRVEANFFCVISALGANEKSKIFYNHIKGKMEASLSGPIKNIIVKPSLLLGERKEFRFSENLAATITKPFSNILPNLLGKYAPIEATKVAKSMIDLSIEGKTSIKIEYLVK